MTIPSLSMGHACFKTYLRYMKKLEVEECQTPQVDISLRVKEMDRPEGNADDRV